VSDPPGPRCALRGLVGALVAARGERVLVLATDLPLLTPDLVLGLIAQPPADAVVPRNGDGSHPLCAVYRREPALAAARAHLAQERLALRPLLDALETRFVEGRDLRALDPDGTALLNVNDESDLARAREAAR
jgi:molybdopterin-guanine dinucleotide biosynthesis protein A